jgi:YgiT-type zinc finger domain-containing protein
MSKTYSACFSCGAVVEEQLRSRELRWQGQLFIFENVPMGVCTRCRGKFLKPEVAKAIDRVLREQGKPARTMQVPVYLYEPDVA